MAQNYKDAESLKKFYRHIALDVLCVYSYITNIYVYIPNSKTHIYTDVLPFTGTVIFKERFFRPSNQGSTIYRKK